jgi:hypothetical protein
MLSIPPALAAKLRNIRAEQLSQYINDEVLRSTEAIYIGAMWSPAAYLTLDGRVIYWDSEGFGTGPEKPKETSDLKEIASVLVLASETFALPELLDLIPAMPDGSCKCEQCDGSRICAWNESAPGTGSGRLLCPTCSGLGWVSEEAE